MGQTLQGEKLSIGEICTRTTVFAERSMSASEAARLMLEQHVGSLVVVEESARGRTVVGVLTDRDIALAVVARDLDPKTVHVGDIMSGNPIACRTDDSMMDVLLQMRRHGIRRIPVTDAQGILIGIVTLDDLLDIAAEQMRIFVEVVESERRREAHIRG